MNTTLRDNIIDLVSEKPGVAEQVASKVIKKKVSDSDNKTIKIKASGTPLTITIGQPEPCFTQISIEAMVLIQSALHLSNNQTNKLGSLLRYVSLAFLA